MAAYSQSTPRGTRAGAGPRPAKRFKEELPPSEWVDDAERPRQMVDYSIKRRAALRSLLRHGLHEDLCDADPMLLRTAKWHGEPSRLPCPVCRKQKLTHLTYTFGAEMGELSGRVRATTELSELAHQYGAFRVYVVEVCKRCSWNHLVLYYVLGDGKTRATASRSR